MSEHRIDDGSQRSESKPNVIQRMRVRLRDGSVVEVCCGPAVLWMDGVVGYRPIGVKVRGTCCHRERS